MPWIIAIMMGLSLLALALALALGNGLVRLQDDLRGRATVQLVEPDPARRDMIARKVDAALRADPAISGVQRVSDADLAAQLRPWLGDDLSAIDLPVPVLFDISLRDGAIASLEGVRARLAVVADGVRIDADAGFLAPVERFMRTLIGFAAVVGLLMMSATGAVVVMAARGALATHGDTVDILHQLGATDVQIARLVQRRLALDALFGGLVGLAGAGVTILALGTHVFGAGSDLARLAVLPFWGWFVLPLVPLAGVGLAMITARVTVRRALERAL